MPAPQQHQLTLISHKLCPYVQRVVTVLEENRLIYQRVDIDLNNKPGWFTQLSPLGKVSVLVIDNGTVLFESAVISEYINDSNGGNLLSNTPLAKARDRSWIEVVSSALNNIGQMYSAIDEQSFMAAVKEFNAQLSHLEEIVPSSVPNTGYFNGAGFSLVDAAFAPVFRYLDVFEQWLTFKFLRHYPNISGWRYKLFARASINQSVDEDYPLLLAAFVAKRSSYLGHLAKEHLKKTVATA